MHAAPRYRVTPRKNSINIYGALRPLESSRRAARAASLVLHEHLGIADLVTVREVSMNFTISRCALASAAGILGVAIAPAFAQSPQLVHKDGLLLLPNVRVEQAAVPVTTTGRGSRADAGLRAYRDTQTGRVRGASTEELIIEALQAPPANDPAGAIVTVLPNGSKRAQLDESFMANMIVQKRDDGQLVMDCLPGNSEARTWLPHAVSTAKETHHEK